MKYPSVQEVIRINHYVIMKYSPDEQIGVKEMNLLESALHRPKQSVLGKDAYPTIYEKAAALFQSLVQNHCFYNANKRTALWSVEYFLVTNGYELTNDQVELERFTVAIATDHLEVADISKWLRKHSSLQEHKG
ncbi:type II toxin-antitoxin system death-on-curing family toxin [Shouchella clausii]|jgi:death on curing protein|uniref:type II toxin-antitoxin system death-on-curing family toxin n=2 Tax=Shouchella clausii TaxID=79880 RepID=UPI000B9698DF|nr:type II toxin-antitoxin system death-on-curing family toxin [Shouchella clausii]PAD43788.1 type II toxin-antitoxin system death-on-curing family toxin [Bacillus sp. 7520-S]AST94646.1 death-on-curing family protein [Shouchella clausii]MBU8597033.1 type II toxin-antitoxin system death-on-curing family toxin [Shouchella clausii]MCR1290302.1 type II toxin-antitoxin system death-on-curing family toxin [Shouchella clausii]MCY1104455.1 type II toxin-antitoxin system death-on-curing family toxin [S